MSQPLVRPMDGNFQSISSLGGSSLSDVPPRESSDVEGAPAAKTGRVPQAPPDTTRRILNIGYFMVVCIALLMGGLLARVVQLQINPSPALQEHSVRTASQIPVIARRGSMVDRHFRPLAVTHVGQQLYADPELIENWATFAADVENATGIDAVEIERKLDAAAGRRYVVLHPLLTDEQVEAVAALKHKGLQMEPRPVRQYPQGLLASQVVGFVGRDHSGLDGMEFALNSMLSEKTGRVSLLRDVQRRPLWIEQQGFESPRNGLDLRLSFDVIAQKIAEEQLAVTCKKYRANRGEIVVMDAKNGQVLAMANWPVFDPSKPTGKAAEKARRNRCVTDPFEPGSIFKPFVHAAATSAGIVGINESVYCGESGTWVTSFGRRLHDVHAHGVIPWGQVLVVSSNIGMGKIGERFGARRMYDAVKRFGFGSQSGTDLPGESWGIVNALPKWTKYSVTSVPMGQEIGVTPIQLVRAFSAFANEGKIVSPSILADETDFPVYQRAVDARTANSTKDLLRKVVTEGTGKNALSDKYQIWGKTGTAQVPGGKSGYKPNAYTASFICGAPLKNPRIIVLVTIHEPDARIAHFGGVISAPAAKEVVEKTLMYLGEPFDVVGEPVRTTVASGD